MNVFPDRCTLLAIATVGLNPIMASTVESASPLPLNGVEGEALPEKSNSPLPILSKTASSCSKRFSVSRRALFSFSAISFKAASLRSAFSPTVPHSRSTLSTISLACFSRSSIMATSRLRPPTSLEYLASCSANWPVRS